MKKKKEKTFISNKRFEVGFHILSQWLSLKQDRKTLKPFFEDNMLQNVAIYGMGKLGELLYKELQDTGILISYAIDRIAESKNIPGIKIYPSDQFAFPKTDAIIVTPVQDYWQIVRLLEEKTSVPIISLEDIVTYCISVEIENE